jgi:PsbN protein
MENAQNALSVGLAVAASVICLTLVSVYTAFGPPSKQLGDPYEDHED